MSSSLLAADENPAGILAGKRVIVLGGSSGIGLAVAEGASRAGADVTITGRNVDALTQVRNRLPQVRTASFDVYNEDEFGRFLAGLPTPVDHVFMSAGSPPYADVASIDREVIASTFGNSFGVMFTLARWASDTVTPGGSLTFMSGTGSRHPAKGLGLSGAHVAAASAAIANLALEIGPVRINAIAAGFVDTPLSARLLGAQLEQRRTTLRNELPIQRVVTADDVAHLALHVMTNTAITGTTIDIDGGQSLLPSVGA